MLFNTNENSISQQVIINKNNIDANTKAIDALGELDTEAIAKLTADVASLKTTTTKNTAEIDSLTNIVNDDAVQITANTSALTKALTMATDSGAVDTAGSTTATAIYELLKQRKSEGYTYFNLSVNMNINGSLYIMSSGLIDLLNLDLETDYIYIGVSTSNGTTKYWANIIVGLRVTFFDGVYYNRVTTTTVGEYTSNENPMTYHIVYLKRGGTI